VAPFSASRRIEADDNATVDEEVVVEQQGDEQTSPARAPRLDILAASALKDTGRKRAQKYHGRVSINSSAAKEIRDAQAKEV
jgi:hypothetical protein